MTRRLGWLAAAVLAVGCVDEPTEGVGELELAVDEASSSDSVDAVGCTAWASSFISGRCDTQTSYANRASSSCKFRYGAAYYAVLDLWYYTLSCNANNGVNGVYFHCCPFL